jgi:hypothetical protein
MAQLQKFRAHESLNADTAADWSQQAVSTVGSSASSVDVSAYHTVHIMTDNDLYFEFTKSSTDSLTPANVFYLMGGDTIYSLKIPKGLGDSIYLWLERKGSSDCAVRMVLS